MVDVDTMLVSTWRHDAHGDHEAVAQAAADVAVETGARHLEAPIWLWYWGEPADVPWERCAVLPLTPGELATKEHALACYPSQIAPLSDRPGDEVVLDAAMLSAFRRPYETYVETHARAPYDPPCPDHGAARRTRRTVFEELHRGDDDPWRTASSWYESRRRALALACLPRERVGSVLEVGCSVGELTAALSERADHVVGVDVSEAALAVGGPSLRRTLGAVRAAARAGPVAGGLLRRRRALRDRLLPLRVASWPRRCGRRAPRSPTTVPFSWCTGATRWTGWPLDGSDVHGAAGRVAAEHDLTLATRVVDDDVLLDLYRPRRRRSLAAEERRRTAVTAVVAPGWLPPPQGRLAP